MNTMQQIIETVLEVNGRVPGCPIEYNKETKKWSWWDETDTQISEFNSFVDAYASLDLYCKNLMVEMDLMVEMEEHKKG